jgi:hypothetical protein
MHKQTFGTRTCRTRSSSDERIGVFDQEATGTGLSADAPSRGSAPRVGHRGIGTTWLGPVLLARSVTSTAPPRRRRPAALPPPALGWC